MTREEIAKVAQEKYQFRRDNYEVNGDILYKAFVDFAVSIHDAALEEAVKVYRSQAYPRKEMIDAIRALKLK